MSDPVSAPPLLYFALGEPSGSTAAGNIAPGRPEVLVVTQVGSGGTLEFGAATPCPTAPLTAPVFTPVDALNGKHLLAALNEVTSPGDTVLEVGCFVVTTASIKQNVLELTGGPLTLQVAITSAGLPSCSLGLQDVTSAHAVNDGGLHLIACRIVIAGGGATVTASVVVDGNARESGTPGSGSSQFPTFTALAVGSTTFTGTIAHVVVHSGTSALTDAKITDRWLAGTTGFAGESSDQRIRRYGLYAGIPAAELDV